jgi:fructose-1,6-bisphosphatase/inositol monophosphatase family enzyme
LIATGFPYYDFDRVDDYIAAMKHLMKHTRGLRRLGSAAVDLAYVANTGRFDAFYEHALHAWDVAQPEHLSFNRQVEKLPILTVVKTGCLVVK